jgi:hypothetical protein
VTAAANAGYAGASGGGANKVMRHLNVGTGTTGSVAFFVPSAPAHIGTYRVMARVQADSANTGIVSISAAGRRATSARKSERLGADRQRGRSGSQGVVGAR